MPKAHPENVAGPFYVEDGCCISCGVPVDAAPDIFDWAQDETSCFLKRQPASQAELDRTMVAIARAEADCIRYRGDDPAISIRVMQAGHAQLCDIPLTDPHPMLRFRVCFASRRADDSPRALAGRLRTWLPRRPGSGWRIKPTRLWSPNTVVFAWDAGLIPFRRPHFNSVRFEAGPGGFRALLHHGYRGAGTGLGLLIHEWLTAELAEDIRWLSGVEDWDSPGFYMPV
jgi:hypothetical protein